jgi:hypothetical protein
MVRYAKDWRTLSVAEEIQLNYHENTMVKSILV